MHHDRHCNLFHSFGYSITKLIGYEYGAPFWPQPSDRFNVHWMDPAGHSLLRINITYYTYMDTYLGT